jgi:hypothetical protein
MIICRPLLKSAKAFGFDHSGFQSGQPLQKPIFYSDPYFTCAWCNTICFIDTLAIHVKHTLPADIGSKIPPECLPICIGCGLGNHFYVGALDFSDAIQQRKR